MSLKLGIILGSGLGKFTDELSSQRLIHEDNTSFHSIRVLSGNIHDRNIVLFSGRRHYYEGYDSEIILENVKIAKNLGLNVLIITNAAGGLNPNFNIADMMLITSHLNFIQKFYASRSVKTQYNQHILSKIKNLSIENNILLRSGSYCCMQGPTYETRAEIRYFSKLGIDAVGMSTVPEILYSNSENIRTIAFSCITNKIAETSQTITDHSEVLEAGIKAYYNFSQLLKLIISKQTELFDIDY